MTQERISAQEYRRRVGASPADPPFAKPQIRLPRPVSMNKTEAAYGEILKREFPGARLLFEPITFHLPSGTRYTPDWIVAGDERIILVVECKGAHIHSAASLRAFKEARSAFPFWRFRFAQKTKEGWAVAE